MSRFVKKMRSIIKKKFDLNLIDKKTYPFFEQVFFRKISRIITPQLAKTKVSPTVINILGFLIGIGGLLMVALGSYWVRVGGGLVLIISYLLDCVDGELARGYKMSDKFGALLDTTLDSIKESFVMFALGGAYFIQTHDGHIEIYLVTILFLQRMFGRTLPWFRMLYHEDVNKIKVISLQNMSKLLRPIAVFFSEAYRSGTIWIVVLLGIITNQLLETLIYFIIVTFALFLFLIYESYKHHKKNH